MAIDRHVRRSSADYAQAMADSLPTGPAWPRSPDGDLIRFVEGLAGIWGDVDGRAADLLERETDPRSAFEMLPDWERAFGLPDPCVAEPLTVGDRQTALVVKMTTQGGQSRAYFEAIAAALGYAIVIKEYAPFMCGVSRCGDTRDPASLGPLSLHDGTPLLLRDGSPMSVYGPEATFRWEVGALEMRFYWTVKIANVRLTWFRVGSGGGQAGVDPLLRIAIATDLECVLRRWKPAHTEIVFDYSGIGTSDPMAGTP